MHEACFRFRTRFLMAKENIMRKTSGFIIGTDLGECVTGFSYLARSNGAKWVFQIWDTSAITLGDGWILKLNINFIECSANFCVTSIIHHTNYAYKK